MDQSEFNVLFKKFKTTNRAFSETEWDDALNSWDEYYRLIRSENGLPFDRWLKNETEGYLPDYLDTKEQKFGHARIGNYEQVMIYQYTGSDKTRYGKYRSVYMSNDAHNCYDKISDVENDFNKNIKSMLKNIVGASSLQEVYNVENSPEYKKFSCKQILRKISVLTSLREDSLYKNEFMWIFNEGALYTLAKILEKDVDSNKTFLENNKAIYDTAKSYAGITATSTKDDYVRLYDFLWYLSDSSYNASELSDFNSINIIFNGAPGTGKTYGVTKGIEKLQYVDSSHYKKSKYIQFHPAFTYQDFIEGIKPLGIVSGNINLQVVNGSFKDFCIFVRKENEEYYKNLSIKPDPEKPADFKEWPHYFFVVDEINRGNLSNIFGETFTLLEKDYRDYDFSGSYTTVKVNLVSTALSTVISRINDNKDLIYKQIGEEVYFGIPFNIHFIGMMNDVDKSIDTFDLALRRRFKWIPKYCDYDVIKDSLIDEGYSFEDVSDYTDCCRTLNDMICDTAKDGLRLGKNYEIGHAFFLKIRNIPGRRKISNDKKKEIFDNYISGTLKEYIRQVSDDSEIDGWIEKAKNSFGIK